MTKRGRSTSRAREGPPAKRNAKPKAQAGKHSTPSQGRPSSPSESGGPSVVPSHGTQRGPRDVQMHLQKDPIRLLMQDLIQAVDASFPLYMTELTGHTRSWVLKDAKTLPEEVRLSSPVAATGAAIRQWVKEKMGCDRCKHLDDEEIRRSQHALTDPPASQRTEQEDRGTSSAEDLASLATDATNLVELERRRSQESATTNHEPTKNCQASQSAPCNEDTEAEGSDGEDNSTTEADAQQDVREEEDFSGVAFDLTRVRVADVEKTYEDIFRKLQQRGLKQIIKAWLRRCHSSKQASFPYNGGKDASSYPDYDPQNPGKRTAPDYWPEQSDWDKGTGCRHREPDHIFKKERLILAMHLLRAGEEHKDAKFPVDDLEDCTTKVLKDCHKDFHKDAAYLLQGLYHARRKELEYLDGQIGPDTIVSVPVPPKDFGRIKRLKRSTRAKGVKALSKDVKKGPSPAKRRAARKGSAAGPGPVPDPAKEEAPAEDPPASLTPAGEPVGVAGTTPVGSTGTCSTSSSVQSPASSPPESPVMTRVVAVEGAHLQSPTTNSSQCLNESDDSSDATLESDNVLHLRQLPTTPTLESRPMPAQSLIQYGATYPVSMPSSLSAPGYIDPIDTYVEQPTVCNTVVSSPVVNSSHLAVTSSSLGVPNAASTRYSVYAQPDPMLSDQPVHSSFHSMVSSDFNPAADFDSVWRGRDGYRYVRAGVTSNNLYSAPQPYINDITGMKRETSGLGVGADSRPRPQTLQQEQEQEQFSSWVDDYNATSDRYRQSIQQTAIDGMPTSQMCMTERQSLPLPPPSHYLADDSQPSGGSTTTSFSADDTIDAEPLGYAYMQQGVPAFQYNHYLGQFPHSQ